jgi:alpha-tubulin suppressor-like RCC1 family protein
MRASLLIGTCLVLGGGVLACGALTGVEWDRVAVRGDGGGGTSGGTSGASGGTSGTSGTSGGPAGMCTGDQVECLGAEGVKCCPNGGEPGLPVTLAAGGQNTCAITATGQVKCWGSNSSGQLGRGTPASQGSNAPQLVFRIPSGATQIAVGQAHICAIVDSLLTCWGSNAVGQLGNASLEGTPLPIVIPVPMPAGWVGIASSASTTCAALGTTGYCWGDNTSFQGGNEIDKVRIITPTAVNGLPALATGAGRITAGRGFSCATGTNQVFCWGTNGSNRLGAAGPTQTSSAVAVGNSTGGTSVVLGEDHGCARVDPAGTGVACWGSNIFGELGNDSVSIVSTGVTTPTGLSTGVTSICAGTHHTCVVHNGVVKCFGDNSQGQGGYAQGVARLATPVQGLTGFVTKQVVCGVFHTCALGESGVIKCWGSNGQGERGDGTTDGNTSTPRDVKW